MSGGYRKYLKNIIPRLAAHEEVDKILCASPIRLAFQDWFEELSNVMFVRCDTFSVISIKRDGALEKALGIFSPDVIYLPVERYFKFKDVPVVNMVRNMEPYSPSIERKTVVDMIKHWAQSFNGKKAAKNADRVIAVSKFVYDFLDSKWKIPKNKIGLVYHGINVMDSTDNKRPDIISDSWDNGFIFTAGSIRPARGLEDLFLAMKYLTLQGENSVRLVIAGECSLRMTSYQKKLEDWVKDNNLSDRICWSGSLDEKEMSWCYQNCRLFVMTSRVESFGQIAGEAMAHGCISVSADNPCLPEIFGDTAIYYKAGNSTELGATIKDVLNMDSGQCEELTKRAIERSNKYSWDTCVSKTVEELLLASKRNS